MASRIGVSEYRGGPGTIGKVSYPDGARRRPVMGLSLLLRRQKIPRGVGHDVCGQNASGFDHIHIFVAPAAEFAQLLNGDGSIQVGA